MRSYHFTLTATHKRYDPPVLTTLGTFSCSQIRAQGAGSAQGVREETTPVSQMVETYAQGILTVRRGDILEVSAKTYWVNMVNPWTLRGDTTTQIILEDLQTPVLTDAISISRVTQVANGAGGFTETWATVSTVDGRVTHSGNIPEEQIAGERMASRLPYMIILAAGASVTPADRLVWGSRTFEVNAVIITSIETAVVCVCVEVV